MAYCRFGDSDVYFYGSCDGGYECCSCRLAAKVKTVFTTGDKFFKCDPCEKCSGNGCDDCMMHGSAHVSTTQEAIDHLLAHRAAGHDVPDEAIEELTEELTNPPSWGMPDIDALDGHKTNGAK